MTDSPESLAPARVSGLLQNGFAISAAAVIALAHLPLLLAYGMRLWPVPHYQFFPLLVLAAPVLVWRRTRDLGPLVPGSRATFIALTTLSVLLLAIAISIFSHWLATLAALGCLGAVAYGLGGRQLVERLAPVWLLLWLGVQLPLGLDESLIQGMQSVITQWSSAVLDQLQLIHFMSGNVVEIPGRRLLVDEACSGIHSLFSALTWTALYVVWVGRRWLTSALLLASVPLWVVVTNIARIVVVVFLRDRWNVAADEGTLHQALGFASFALLLALIWSTGNLVEFFTLPGHRRSKDVEAWEANGEPKPTGQSSSPRRSLPWKGVVIAYAILTVAQAGAGTAWMAGVLGPRDEPVMESVAEWIAAPTHMPALGLAAMPEHCGAWEGMAFEATDRQAGSDFGEFSQTWQYRHPRVQAAVSVDYPFRGWHELTVCYKSQGWKVRERSVRADSAANASSAKAVAVELRHEASNKYGYLFFEEFDTDQRPLTPPVYAGDPSLSFGQELARRLQARTRLPSVFWNSTAEDVQDQTVVQLQVFVEAYSPLMQRDREEAEALFQVARESLLSRWAAHQRGGP